jgi:hypothetical protein
MTRTGLLPACPYPEVKVAKYDPRLIEEYADQLYWQATLNVIVCRIAGIMIGLGCGLAVSQLLIPAVRGTTLAIGIGTGVLLGLLEGQRRAFLLRLQAQLALCQVQTEKNTAHCTLLVQALSHQDRLLNRVLEIEQATSHKIPIRSIPTSPTASDSPDSSTPCKFCGSTEVRIMEGGTVPYCKTCHKYQH